MSPQCENQENSRKIRSNHSPEEAPPSIDDRAGVPSMKAVLGARRPHLIYGSVISAIFRSRSFTASCPGSSACRLNSAAAALRMASFIPAGRRDDRSDQVMHHLRQNALTVWNIKRADPRTHEQRSRHRDLDAAAATAARPRECLLPE